MGRENLSVELDLPSGYVSPYRLAEGQDYARLVSGWSEAATNLVAGDISGMETSITKLSERMSSVIKLVNHERNSSQNMIQ